MTVHDGSSNMHDGSFEEQEAILTAEGDRIAALKESLGETRALCGDMVQHLEQFEARVANLEPLIMPLHRSISVISRVSGNIEQTLHAVRILQEQHEMVRQEEPNLATGPTMETVRDFMDALDRVRAGLAIIDENKLSYCQVTTKRLQSVSGTAIQQLLARFKEWLQEHGPEAPASTTTATMQDGKTMDSMVADCLFQIAQYASASNLGSDVVNAYGLVRAKSIMKTLQPLFSFSTDAAALGSSVYVRGTHPLIGAVQLFFYLCKCEDQLAKSVLPTNLIMDGLQRAVKHPADLVQMSCEAVANQARKALARSGRHGDLQYADLVWILDVVQSITAAYWQFVLRSVDSGAQHQSEANAIPDGSPVSTVRSDSESVSGSVSEKSIGSESGKSPTTDANAAARKSPNAIAEQSTDGLNDDGQNELNQNEKAAMYMRRSDHGLADQAKLEEEKMIKQRQLVGDLVKPSVKLLTTAALHLIRGLLDEVGAAGSYAAPQSSSQDSSPGAFGGADPTTGDAGDVPPAANATVSEQTSTCLNALRKLLDYQAVVEALLDAWTDGGHWDGILPPISAESVEASSSASSKEAEDGEGGAVYFATALYYQDVLQGVEATVDRQARSFRRTVTATLFQLNNANYILRALRSTPGIAALLPAGAGERKYEELVETLTEAYLGHWMHIAKLLQDDSTRSANLTPRDRLKAFASEFDDMVKEQSTCAFPDADLRDLVISKLRSFILPVFVSFYNANQSLFQAAALQSRSKLDPDSIDADLTANRLFQA